MLIVLFALASVWILAYALVGEASLFRHWVNALFPLGAFVAITTVVAAESNYDVIDKSRYAVEFESLSFASLPEAFYTARTEGREPAFLLFNWLVGTITHDAHVFFLITAALCSLMLATTLWVILGSGWQTAVVFYLTYCFGFFIDYSSFLLRQGLSISFLFLALALILRGAKRPWVILLLGIGVLFHWSSAVPAGLILLIAVMRLRTDILVGVWTLFSLSYFTGLNSRLAEPLGSHIEQVETYSDPALAQSYAGGTNRPIFWVLSAGPLAFAYAARKRLDTLPEWYPKLLNAFLLLNCYYLCLGFVYFGDRLAAYSWSIVPVLVALPFLGWSGKGQRTVRLGMLMLFTGWAVYFGSFASLQPT